MASLTEAYQRVRETTARNNAAREGGGILEEIFNGLMPQLQNDLNPENINKPLSGVGSLVNAVTGFRERQIEQEADRRVNFATAVYEAETPLRERTRADEIDAELEKAKIKNTFNANNSLQAILPTVRGSDSTKEFMQSIVNNKSSLYPSIKAAADNKHLFKVFNKEEQPTIQDGQLLYTADDGRRLYASGNKQHINLDYQRTKLTNIFTKALEDNKLSVEQLIRATPEEKQKLFASVGFKSALDKTLENVPREMLDAHEFYNAALTKRIGDIDKVLEKKNAKLSTLINAQIRLTDRATRDWEASGRPEVGKYFDEYNKHHIALKALTDKKLEFRLNAQFQTAVKNTVFKKAFALSLIGGFDFTKERADTNINSAIQLAMQDKALKDYKEQLQYYYYGVKNQTGPASTGTRTKQSPPDKTSLAKGHGKEPPRATATNKTQRLLPPNPPETPEY